MNRKNVSSKYARLDSLQMPFSCVDISSCERHAFTGTSNTWVLVGVDTSCDTSAGEIKIDQSSARFLTLEECKRSCEDFPQCQVETSTVALNHLYVMYSMIC